MRLLWWGKVTECEAPAAQDMSTLTEASVYSPHSFWWKFAARRTTKTPDSSWRLQTIRLKISAEMFVLIRNRYHRHFLIWFAGIVFLMFQHYVRHHHHHEKTSSLCCLMKATCSRQPKPLRLRRSGAKEEVWWHYRNMESDYTTTAPKP